ncbi:hypothetical protein K438DRAFT_1781855 [Mycena galopus ATCC 62051]|nr:hypothetical protein K438DRAFT_1781855 [Mycena galopus ATCC 62051]
MSFMQTFGAIDGDAVAPATSPTSSSAVIAHGSAASSTRGVERKRAAIQNGGSSPTPASAQYGGSGDVDDPFVIPSSPIGADEFEDDAAEAQEFIKKRITELQNGIKIMEEQLASPAQSEIWHKSMKSQNIGRDVAHTVPPSIVATVAVTEGSIALPNPSPVTVTVGSRHRKCSLQRGETDSERLTKNSDKWDIGIVMIVVAVEIALGRGILRSTWEIERKSIKLPKLATVTVTGGLVALPKPIWDVTVGRRVATIHGGTVW